MATNVQSAAPPNDAAEQILGHGKRMLDQPECLARRTRSKKTSSSSPILFELPRPVARKHLAPLNTLGAGVKNLGKTCYVASALQLALSVSCWRSVCLTLFFCLHLIPANRLDSLQHWTGQSEDFSSCQRIWVIPSSRKFDSQWSHGR